MAHRLGHPTMDADAIYVPLFRSPNIFVNRYNEDFNGMVEEAQSQMDEKKRLVQYHRINNLWIEECRPSRSTRSTSTAPIGGWPGRRGATS